MEEDNYYMKQALAEAKAAEDEGEIPIGAVIVCQGRIIAKAHNMTQRLIDVTAHAEMQAITSASAGLGNKYLNECTLYVTIEPCVMCAGAIAWAQLGRLVFGATDEKRGFSKYANNLLHPKTVVLSGVMAEECAALMKSFFAKRR
ncbi:MAG: nucleoside deaminase [Bacteroidales bacterium]|nr:nucleoside deaminase [Bacteroidales bacterium]